MVEQYYSVQQAAEILGRSTRSIYRDIYDHSLYAKKIGKSSQWRIPESAIKDFADGRVPSAFGRVRKTLVEAKPNLTSDERMQLVQVLIAE